MNTAFELNKAKASLSVLVGKHGIVGVGTHAGNIAIYCAVDIAPKLKEQIEAGVLPHRIEWVVSGAFVAG